ncbi:MAG: ATP-binding protein [Quinella sp. 1Q7]|nr:ATP-binding protein [Quinella sp. 1Q7]
MNNRPYLLERLFKDTLVIFLLSLFISILGYVIDGIIVGSFLGRDSIAAIGLVLPYQKFVGIFPSIMVLGMQILCSKSLGKGDLQEANEIFSQALIVTLSVSFLMTFGTLLFTEQIADLLGATEDLGEIRLRTTQYFLGYSFGLPAVAAVTLLTPIMQLDSDRRRAVYSATVLSGCNIVGDLFVVFVLNGTIWEVALVTSISYWLTAGVLFMHFRKPEASFKLLPKNFSIKHLPQIFLNGSTEILRRVSSLLRVSFLTRTVVALGGGVGIAAYSAVINFLEMAEIFPKALGSSTQMIGGILIGEQDRHSILHLMKISLKYALILTFAIVAGVYLAAPLIAKLYTVESDTETYQMTIEGLRTFVLFLPPCTIGMIIQRFYQAYGRYKLVSNMTIADNIAFIVPIVLILTPYLGMDGLWLAFPLSYVASLIMIFCIVCYHCGRITFKLDDYLLLPKDFDVPADKQLNITVTSMAEVMNLSIRAQAFCESQGIEERRSKLSGLCIEEMAGNIVDYGFDDGKKHFVDIRIIIKGEQVILRLRDDCRPFNPKKWAELYNPDDPFSHIGIRLVRKMATEFDYVNVLKLNNLLIKL